MPIVSNSRTVIQMADVFAADGVKPVSWRIGSLLSGTAAALSSLRLDQHIISIDLHLVHAEWLVGWGVICLAIGKSK